MAVRELGYRSCNYSISYEIINPKKNSAIVFLHGWGSSKEIMKQAFGDRLKDFRLIFIDLPGFGGSCVSVPIKTLDYANIVKLFLDSLHVGSYVVVGHSFGGKIGAILNPKKLILLSSAGIPTNKSIKVKTKIVLFKVFKHIVPKSMYRLFASSDVGGMSQTMYEIFKSVVDEDFRPIFKKVTSTTLVFWGKEDRVTPINSGKEISQIIMGSRFYPLTGDHFFFMKNSEFIADKIGEINGNI